MLGAKVQGDDGEIYGNSNSKGGTGRQNDEKS